MGRPDNTIENAMRYVDKETCSPCWLWFGTVSERGYGKITVQYKDWLAHRYFYAQLKGSLIEGLTIDHLCQNKTCVNPDHLEQVTHQENNIRYTSKIFECKSGHPLEGENLYITPDGRRQCRTCRRIASSKHYYGA